MSSSKTAIFLLFFAASCAEKRQAPKPKTQPNSSTTMASSVASTSTKTTPEKKIPAAFLSSDAAKSFVDTNANPASEGSLSFIEALDLNEDGALEVILVPGPRFCGTGGCLLPKIFQERDKAWLEISALQSKVPQSNEVSSVELLSEVFGGFHSLKIKRLHSNDWVLRYNGNLYQVAPESPTSDQVSEEKSASLMLNGSYYDKARGVAPIGLWDKLGANKNAKILVVVTPPDKKIFRLELGTIDSPDAWHQAFFPTDFDGAPAVLSPGVYQVEYRLNDQMAATREFTVK
jgi:hypothetical protein